MNKNIEKAYEIFERATSGLVSKKASVQLLQEYLSLIRKAAYKGNSEAQFQLGTLYQDEQFMNQVKSGLNAYTCKKKSFYWFEKSCKQEHPYACHNLGGFYGIGDIVEKSIDRELDLYLKAFQLGLNEAGYAIAMTYKSQANYRDSILWIERVIQNQPNDGEALFELGKYYYEGLGTKKSYKKAYSLFNKAYQSDYITQYTKEEVLFYIGKMHFYGQYVQKSISKAKHLFEEANVDNDHEDIREFCQVNFELLKRSK